jgi:site-specific DNA-methyltransferase (adenine-specific)
MTAPYWSDDRIALYVGDMREVLPALGVTADCVIADPMYCETAHEWDRWPDGWLDVAANVTRSLWCFGSLRMFGERWPEFTAAGWKLSHDAEAEWVDHAAWEKHNGSGFAADRLRRVHELAAHWYRGRWRDVYHEVPRVPYDGPNQDRAGKRRSQPAHTGTVGASGYASGDRLARSVIRAPRPHRGIAIHPTQKPPAVLEVLIAYACPPGGLVVEPFGGSCSGVRMARETGRRGVAVERDERQAERAARWLCQGDLLAAGAS